MSTDREALAVDADSPPELLARAAEILSRGTGVVRFESRVALRSTGTRLLCDVVDPAPSERRCENEYAVLLENAQRSLEASALVRHLPDLPQTWRVVDEREASTVELWRAR
jgi:hypothetical protein